MAKEKKKQIVRRLQDIQANQLRIYEAYTFKEKSREDYLKERQDLQDETARMEEKKKIVKEKLKLLSRVVNAQESEVLEYINKDTTIKFTQEMADRFLKKVIVCDESNIEIEWNASAELPKELMEYQLTINEHMKDIMHSKHLT